MGQEDADLIRRWQRGEPAAFAALVQRWQQPVARFLARLLGRNDLVQDLCQEVFLRVYLAQGRYRETGTFSTWLYRIALNLARDAGRRCRREPPMLPVTTAPLDHAIQAEALLVQRELADAVADALAELPPALREVLVLRHYEEMSFEEMGRLLQIAPSTLKSRFGAALSRLRERFQQLGYSDEDTP
jgi:RNA polymerase sigma-70 factor (ECF subfamily)